jgi:ribosome biogenesis GTPase
MHDTDVGNEARGVVVANFGTEAVVEDAAGRLQRCKARRQLGQLVCGDRVRFKTGDHGDCRIEKLEPRHSELARPDPQGRKKIIAANIDQILVVTSGKPSFNPGLVDRYLVAAEMLGIPPVIILNKIDLLSDAERQQLDQELQEFARIGYRTLHTSTKTAHGLDELLPILQHRTSIFVGQSGVGKSSLINALLPDAAARVGAISEATGKGTHTTTVAWLYHLPDRQGDVIDSPGVREFGLWDISPSQLAQGFREFGPYAEQCRFRNCLHKGEPGCAVRAAVEAGEISKRRYESYLRMLDSLENPEA